jgi:hypothetical protein
MQPTGLLSLTGLSVEQPFIKNFLDRWKVRWVSRHERKYFVLQTKMHVCSLQTLSTALSTAEYNSEYGICTYEHIERVTSHDSR